MNDYIFKISNLEYKYSDETHALKGVTMNILRGKTTAILGGNGAGKSTLLLALNGLLKASNGSILYNDIPLKYSKKELNKLRQSVGIVFQDPDSQLFSSSVYQDISFGVMNMKLSKEEVIRRVDSAMELTGITHLKGKPTHCLSYGQKKRVAIAGVLAMEPKVLILDEPTVSLDPIGASKIMKLLRDIQKKLELTIIISTHDIDIVPIYCDYAYVLNEGKIVLDGTPKDIFLDPSKIREVNLRLPRIAHLIEILNKRDNFNFTESANKISEARKLLINYYK